MVQAAAAVEIHATDPAPVPAHACDRMELEELAAEAAEAAEVAAGRQDTIAAVGRPSSFEAVAKAPAGSPLVRSHVHCRCRRRHHDRLCWRDCRVVVQAVQEVAAEAEEEGSSSSTFRWNEMHTS